MAKVNNNEEHLMNEEEKDTQEVQEETVEDLDLDDQEQENVDQTETNVEDDDKYAALEDNFIRLQADFVNFKRRTEQERKDYIELGSRKVLNDLLTVIDNFERAIKAHTNEESFKEGVELIYKQLLDLLEKNNVTEIKCLNEKFDPEYHHAVLVEEKQGVEEGIVIDVLQKGYLIGEKVLRPAMVKVSQ